MRTHTSSGADEVLASTAEDGPLDPLDALLKQIVGGYFVLTDGQGSVSKWSEPAELLFGRPAQEILGQSFFDRLVQPPLPPHAEAWRRFLESGAAPSAPGRVEVKGLHSEGHAFPIETVFVPVKLDEGFDFSLFLEDLGFELPVNLMLLRMRQQHPVVVRALRQALDEEMQPWEGWRTAGTLVVFRPTEPTPWIEAELAAREAARARADAEVEEAIVNPDPGVQGSTVRDLDDAAAVVARLLSALERIDDLERMAAALPAQVQEARRDAEASRSRADAAEREAVRLRSDLERAVGEIRTGGNDQQHLELLARMERLERARLDEDAARASALKAAEAARAELAQRLERAEADRARAAEAIEGRVAEAVAEAQRRADEALEEARTRADSARSSFESRILELEKLRSGDAGTQQADLIAQLEQVRAEHEEAVQAARHELAETLERIEREREREAETARAELRAALERIEHVQRESDALREQLQQVTVERHEAEGLAGEERRRLADLQRDAEATRARIDALQSELAEEREQVAALKEQGAGFPAEELGKLRAEQAAILRAQGELAARLSTLSGSADAGAVEALAADLRRSQGEIAAAQEQLAARAREVEAVIAAQKDLGAEFSERYEEMVRARAEFAARQAEIQRAQEQLDARSADILRSQDDFAQRHDEVRQAQAEMSRRHDELVETIDSLRAAQSNSVEARAAAEREQAELRAFVEASRRERDEFRASTEHALAQLADVRQALREHESSISVQIPSNAVEHEELTAATAALRAEIGEALATARGEIGALRDAEASLTAKLEALTGAGEAVDARLEALSARVGGVDALNARVDAIAAAGGAASARIDELALSLAAEKAGLAARLDETREALTSRVDAVADSARAEASKALSAAEAAQLAAAEAAAAGESVAARLDGVAGADEIAALRSEASEARQAAREIAARVDDIDRGAGSVLADVRSVRERVEEVAALARTAQEAGTAGADELRAAVARLSGELQVARGELERAGEEALGAREQAATAQQAATAAREDAGRVREEAASMRREIESGRERVTALGSSVERLGEALGQVGHTAESAQTEATAARRSGKELAQLVSELDQRTATLRTEMGAGRERLQAIDASVGRLGSVVENAGADASAALAQADLLRVELAEVRALAEKASAGIDAMRADVESVKAAAEKVAAGAEANRATVKAGEERLEAMGAEVTFALKSLDEIKAGLTSAGQAAVIARREAEQAKKAAQTAGEGSKDNVTEVFAQLLGLAAKKGQSGIHKRPSNPATRRPGPVKREPRHGFDDASRPMATLGLDGKFRELNPAFVKLVGYQEHEFAKATWPSPHDRAVYQQQQEQLSQLASGEIESVTVQSTYMHGQGLMVPVIGELRAVPGEDGLPLHLLLEAEDRHSS